MQLPGIDGLQMLDELAELAGVGPRVAALTARAMNGEIDFRAAVRERVALLAGLPQTVLARAAERIEIDPAVDIAV